ncbi:putative membrane protein YdjX (TVP38/TMEM64 family) [Kitasatospora sp. MAA4]|uniref:TVP38/TMEM64 family protein n=1 Tax=Kitasatospora sp. MAA4 TaxID=3035093 RepID=UPI0024770AA9|nr:TVP38/TMEM64 family protein [Kitasatospora sp. MAA4]MDH6137201.1 putative membrane protein YdjX (TVP38/TMEM64 family) [Kitasatospora sp. MAA4]
MLLSRLTSPWARFALLALILAGAAGSVALWDPRHPAGAVPGAWRAPAFALLFALGTLAFVPKPALNVAAGVLFGVERGLPLAVLGTTLGAALAFGLGRGLGREAVRPLLRGKVLTALDRRLTEQGFRSVLLLRLIPGVPFQAANLGAAFSGVRLRPFLAATGLGVLPGTAAYVVAGSAAGSPGSPAFLASTAVIVLMGLLSLAALRRTRRPAPETA